MILIFCRDNGISASLPKLKTQHITFNCKDGQLELKNNKLTESPYHRDKFPPSNTVILTDFSLSEVRLVVEQILISQGKISSVNFFRILSILNILGTHFNNVLQNDSEMDSHIQETPSHIATLPNELLIKIFSHLSTQDLRDNVAKVSKQFKDLCKSPLVHQVVTVNAGENEADFLRAATMITELHVNTTDKQVCQDELLAVANHCHLKVLLVNGTAVFDPQFFLCHELVEMVEKFEEIPHVLGTWFVLQACSISRI